ncbi:MAG: antitoxin MazE [Clostridia bacterium]|nr:antitoxin MazE [Clostridia bacterium]
MNISNLKDNPCSFSENELSEREMCLEKGYQEMSRINLSLAEEALTSDNDALLLAEQNLRSVKKRDS